jgi:hypothetical protein
MPTIKISANFYVVVIVAIGAGSIVYLVIQSPSLAPAFVPLILTFMAGAIGQILKAKETDVKVDAATAQSEHNGAQLAVIAPQVTQAVADVADNTALTQETHGLVNGQASHLLKQTTKFESALIEMAANRTEIAALKAEAAAMVELARTTLAEITARDEGKEQGRQQLLDDTTAMDVARASAPDVSDGAIEVTAPVTIDVKAPE